MTSISFKKTIPVKYEVDIFVLGGGPSGISAGVTAARAGRKVFLAESHTCLGSMGTAGYIPIFMEFTDGINFWAGGFGKEVHDKLIAQGASYSGKYLRIPAEKLKRLYDTLAIESGMGFSFATTLIGVETDANNVKFAICHAKSGVFAVKADIFVDCSGDGDMCFHAGANFEKGSEDGTMMPGTLCSLWAGIDWETAGGPERRNHKVFLEKAFQEKIFTVEDRHHSGIARTGHSLGSGNIGHTFGVDGTDEVSLTKAYITGRRYMPEYQEYYRRYFEGFENMELAASGSLLGVRETRRITGDYQLCIDDFLKKSRFEDQIGACSYPVDIHPTTASKKDFDKSMDEYHTFRYQDGDHYGIPYRSLRVKGFDNLLVAGRCLFADKKMQSSVRTMPGCFVTGQAAGMAAAIASEKCCGTRDFNIKELQDRLTTIGGFIY